MSRLALLTLLPLSLLLGCAGSSTKADTRPSHPEAAHVVKPASAAQRAAMIDRVKSLAGTWELTAPDGTTTTIVFGVTAAGSAVREVMFPGTEHEMTNLYHMDGESLVVTHYCGNGTQPRMRATAAAPDRIDFEFDSVTNMTTADQDAMANLSLVWVDADHLRQEWRSFKNGKPSETAAFELHRRKE
jgi:hypothetical protein